MGVFHINGRSSLSPSISTMTTIYEIPCEPPWIPMRITHWIPLKKPIESHIKFQFPIWNPEFPWNSHGFLQCFFHSHPTEVCQDQVLVKPQARLLRALWDQPVSLRHDKNDPGLCPAFRGAGDGCHSWEKTWRIPYQWRSWMRKSRLISMSLARANINWYEKWSSWNSRKNHWIICGMMWVYVELCGFFPVKFVAL